MEQARIEHASNGSLLTYITSADALMNHIFKILYIWERSGSVVECLTRDLGAAG